MLKNYRYSYFYNWISDSVFRFSVKPHNIWKNRVKTSPWVNFRKKVMKKWYIRKLICWNSSFFYTDRKMKSIIRHIFISIITHTNVMHFLLIWWLTNNHQELEFSRVVKKILNAVVHVFYLKINSWKKGRNMFKFKWIKFY